VPTSNTTLHIQGKKGANISFRCIKTINLKIKIHKNVYHAFCSSGHYPSQTYIWQAKIHILFFIVIYLFYFIFTVQKIKVLSSD